MNTEQIKILIETVISNRRIGSCGKYRLGIFDGELIIVSDHSQIVLDPTVATLTEYQICSGFNSGQWDSMAGKIAKYCERAEKCLNDLTH